MRNHPEKHVGALKLGARLQITTVVFLMLLILAAVAGAGVIVYLTASQELSASFYSAHRDLRVIWDNFLVTVLAASAAVGVVALLFALVGFFRLKRSLENAGKNVLRAVEQIGDGNLRAEIQPGAAGHLEPLAMSASRGLEALRGHLHEVKGTSVELHRVVQRLNYLVFEEEKVTLDDLKQLTSNLNTLSRELTNILKWFEI